MAGEPTQPLGLRERKKRDARRAIRRVALGLFVAHGYESVSVEQIAAAADVSRTTFFNYFPSKEAVITDPDPEFLAAQRALCDARPDDEPLWQALTSVILDDIHLGQDVLIAQKRMKALSPSVVEMVHRSNERTFAALRDWSQERVAPEERASAQLQFNLVIAAMATVFAQWQADEPFEVFEAKARAYLDQIGRAFG